MPAIVFAQEWKKSYALAQEHWGNSWETTAGYLEAAERSGRNDLGIFDPDYLVILNDLGLAFYESGRTADAISTLKQSLRYRLEIYRPDDREVLLAKLNLARIAAYQDPSLSKSLYSELSGCPNQEIRLKAIKSYYDYLIGTGEVDLASELVGVLTEDEDETKYLQALLKADLFRRKGSLEASRKELEKLSNKFRMENTNDLLVKSVEALFYDQKGLLLVEEHAFAAAERALKNALETKTYLGRPKEEFVVTYNSLARLYQEFGLYEKALEAIDKALQKCTHHCERILQNKASIYLITGNMLEAELIYNEIYDNYAFKKPADELEFLLNYANTFQKGALSRTNPALEKAEKLVYEHRDRLTSRDLGHYYAARGAWLVRNGSIEEAIQVLRKSRRQYIEAYDSSSFLLRKTEMNLGLCYVMSKQSKKGLEMLRIADQRERELIRYVYPLMSRSEQLVFMQELRDDLNLFYSALIPVAEDDPNLRKLLFEKQLIYKGLTLQVARSLDTISSRIPKDLIEEYTILRRRLARVYTEGSVNNDLFSAGDINRLRELESRMARENGVRLSGLPEADSITSRLNPDEVLIEIIRYENQNPAEQDKTTYVALVIGPDSDYPDLIAFENGDELEGRQLKYYLNAIKFEIRDTVSYNKFWQPLEKYTENKKTCYLVSDGFFYKVNPSALWKPEQEKFLGEDLKIRQLNNAAELISVKGGNSILRGERKILLVGDPDLSDISDSRFTDLPGTREELRMLREQFHNKGWKVNTLASSGATKSALLAAEYGSIIHFATHGFFSQKQIPGQSQLPDLNLFRSGLVLSADEGGAGDLLTAFEVTDMPLSNVNLAVLSACETGLGELKNGDGIHGLQYAFFSAGVRSVLLSLWQVNDEVTKEYMIAFYRKLLETGNKRLAYEAVEAQMRKKYSEPRYWAAFIYLGD